MDMYTAVTPWQHNYEQLWLLHSDRIVTEYLDLYVHKLSYYLHENCSCLREAFPMTKLLWSV
jgi:hypothetical protein